MLFRTFSDKYFETILARKLGPFSLCGGRWLRPTDKYRPWWLKMILKDRPNRENDLVAVGPGYLKWHQTGKIYVNSFLEIWRQSGSDPYDPKTIFLELSKYVFRFFFYDNPQGYLSSYSPKKRTRTKAN